MNHIFNVNNKLMYNIKKVQVCIISDQNMICYMYTVPSFLTTSYFKEEKQMSSLRMQHIKQNIYGLNIK